MKVDDEYTTIVAQSLELLDGGIARLACHEIEGNPMVAHDYSMTHGPCSRTNNMVCVFIWASDGAPESLPSHVREFGAA